MKKLIVFLCVLAILPLIWWIYKSIPNIATDDEYLKPTEHGPERSGSYETVDSDLVEPLYEEVESMEFSNGTSPENSSDEKALITGRSENYTVLEDGSLAYDEGTKLEISHGYVISSPTGLMFSDAERTMMYGDLIVNGPDGQIIVDVALISDPYGDFGFTLKGHPDLKDLDFENLKAK